jgi:Sensors of blue-light using FAD
MYFLTYTSIAKLASVDLNDILEKARTKNAAHGVTGLLISRPNSFFQLLEGTKSEVLSIFQKIAVDSRHDNIKVLFEVEMENATRIFPSWQMGSITGSGNNENQKTLLDSLQPILKSDSPPRDKILHMLREFSATAAPTSAQEILIRASRPDKAS